MEREFYLGILIIIELENLKSFYCLEIILIFYLGSLLLLGL